MVGTTLPLNMGVLGIVAAFVLGTALGVSEDDIFAGFPGDLFVILVGVTYLFAIASNNGTVNWLVHAAVRAVGGRAAAIPWVFFFVTAVADGVRRGRPGRGGDHRADRARLRGRLRHQPGADGPDDHQRRDGRRVLADQRVRLASSTASSSARTLDENAMLLFVSSFLFNFALSVVVFFLFGGRKLLRKRVATDDGDESAGRFERRSRRRPTRAAGAADGGRLGGDRRRRRDARARPRQDLDADRHRDADRRRARCSTSTSASSRSRSRSCCR